MLKFGPNSEAAPGAKMRSAAPSTLRVVRPLSSIPSRRRRLPIQNYSMSRQFQADASSCSGGLASLRDPCPVVGGGGVVTPRLADSGLRNSGQLFIFAGRGNCLLAAVTVMLFLPTQSLLIGSRAVCRQPRLAS
jgi:hypothetical protein